LSSDNEKSKDSPCGSPLSVTPIIKKPPFEFRNAQMAFAIIPLTPIPPLPVEKLYKSAGLNST